MFHSHNHTMIRWNSRIWDLKIPIQLDTFSDCRCPKCPVLVCPPPCLQHSHTGRNVPWPLGTTGQWEPSGQWSRAHWSAVVSVQLYSGQCVTSRYIPDNFTVWRNVYSRFSIHWHQLRLGHGAGIKWSQECVSNMSCGRQLCNYSSVAGQLIISCFLPQKQQQWYVDCRNGGIEEKVAFTSSLPVPDNLV